MSITLPAKSFSSACLIAAALFVTGCDKQKPTDPQGQTATQAITGADNDEASAASTAANGQRYTISTENAGKPISDARVLDESDAPASLTELAGKPMIVNLWATWCAPCVEELPTLDRLAQMVGDSGHVITLSEDLDEDGRAPRQFLDDRGWRAVTAWHDPENAVGVSYGASLPTTIIVGSDGREIARVIGPIDWTGAEARALLERAGFRLGAPTAPAAPAPAAEPVAR